jgi:di/tricarboxylate transporter
MMTPASNDEIQVSLVALSKEEHKKVKALFVQLAVLIVLSCSVALLVILSLYEAAERKTLIDANKDAIDRQLVIVDNLCSVIENQILIYNASNPNGELPTKECTRLDLEGE